jgi:hypothetical protein
MPQRTSQWVGEVEAAHEGGSHRSGFFAMPIVSAGATRRTNYALVVIAYGFFALGIGINVWNATTGGALTDMALPAALGLLAEAVVFFLPAWALTLPIGQQTLAWALFVFISVFALTNSLRMASIIAADQATFRADRQTEGIPTAYRALDVARTKRDEACGRGLGKSVACKVRQAKVTKPEANQTQATAKVVAGPTGVHRLHQAGDVGEPGRCPTWRR